MFFLKDGEVVIRKYIDLPPGVAAFNIGFYEWARKKKIEIDLTDDPTIKELELEMLNEKIGHARE